MAAPQWVTVILARHLQRRGWHVTEAFSTVWCNPQQSILEVQRETWHRRVRSRYHCL